MGIYRACRRRVQTCSGDVFVIKSIQKSNWVEQPGRRLVRTVARLLLDIVNRRANTPGATYFFTVVTYNRQHLFKTPDTLQILRKAFHTVKQRYPFTIDAIVILPNHLHCLWTLPPNDADFSTRWRLIKTFFSRHCPKQYKRQRSLSRLKKSEQAIWQRRFWEHQIRNKYDFERHVDYIHYNPVRHQLDA